MPGTNKRKPTDEVEMLKEAKLKEDVRKQEKIARGNTYKQLLSNDQQIRERSLVTMEQRTTAIQLLAHNSQLALYVDLYSKHGNQLPLFLAQVQQMTLVVAPAAPPAAAAPAAAPATVGVAGRNAL